MLRNQLAELRKEQASRESAAIERGRLVAVERMDDNMEKGRLDSLPYKSAVMKRMVTCVDEILHDLMTRKTSSKLLLNLREVMKETRKYVDISVLTSDYILANLTKEALPYTVVTRQLGTRIMRMYQMALYMKHHPHYLKEMERDFDKENISEFNHVYKTFIKRAGIDTSMMEDALEGSKNLGVVLIGELLSHKDTFLDSVTITTSNEYSNTVRDKKLLTLKGDVIDLMEDIVSDKLDNIIDRIPSVCPPYAWKKVNGHYTGGFVTDLLRLHTPLILGDKWRRRPKEVPQIYLDGLNKLQNTPFKINPYMLNVVQKIFNKDLEYGKVPRSTNIPLTDIPQDINLSEEEEKQLRKERREQHAKNAETFSKSYSLLIALQQSRELLNRDIYFVWALDYRGRFNCMSNGLNLQSNDTIKSLLTFSEGEEVGEDGLFWLKVRAANCFGYDKAEPEDRVKFIDDMISSGAINMIASDPIGNYHLWKDCEDEKPMQFLATCHELAIAYRLPDPTKHISKLPVGLDGSCNGSQHLAVLSQDPDLARSVNVLPDTKCNDIYQDVSDALFKALPTQELHQHLLSRKRDPKHIKDTVNWLYKTFLKPPRKLVKRCVMTLPYGATETGYMKFIREVVEKYDMPATKNKMIAIMMMAVSWILNKRVGGAVRAMDYIKDSAAKSIDKYGTFKYKTALGLEVDCYKPHIKSRKVRVLTFQVRVKEVVDDKASKTAILNNVAPNFIHSMDACHLLKVLTRDDIPLLYPIHDDFGTLPSQTGKLYKAIREEFVNLYKGHDYFKELLENDIEFEYGEGFDIEEVKKSVHFFL